MECNFFHFYFRFGPFSPSSFPPSPPPPPSFCFFRSFSFFGIDRFSVLFGIERRPCCVVAVVAAAPRLWDTLSKAAIGAFPPTGASDASQKLNSFYVSLSLPKYLPNPQNPLLIMNGCFLPLPVEQFKFSADRWRPSHLALPPLPLYPAINLRFFLHFFLSTDMMCKEGVLPTV
jgi:hypothetical protein